MNEKAIRSVIDFGDMPLEIIKENHSEFLKSGISKFSKEEKLLVGFVNKHASKYKGEPPNIQIIKEFFTKSGELSVIDLLNQIEKLSGYGKSNYKRILDETRELHIEKDFDFILQEAARIKISGRVYGTGKNKIVKKGVKDAVDYFLQNSDSLTRTNNFKLSGIFNVDAQEAIEEYKQSKLIPNIGRITGITNIDDCCKGLKKGELMLIAAFTGQLKTSFSLYYSYITAIRFKWHVYYACLEMRYEHVRKILAALHSTHPKFTQPVYRDGTKNPDYDPVAPISYSGIRDTELTDDEEKLFEKIWWDLTNGYKKGEYGGIFIECPDGEMSIKEINRRALIQHQKMKTGLGKIVIDHGGLVELDANDKRVRSNMSEVQNHVARDASRMALHFNGGEGIPVVMPYQINRKGWREAQKNDGEYKMDALAYANEAERSASMIMTIFLDEALEKLGEAKLCNLKNRDNPKFSPFNVKIDFNTRRFHNIDLVEEIENMDDILDGT